jgi:hypothetical protein
MTEPDGATAPIAECGHQHPLLFAASGDRADSHRIWVVAADGFAPQEAGWPWGDAIALPRGTRLRYDQRDYDSSWRMEAWDRFCVLDGPDAGRCVFIGNPNVGGPVEDDEPPRMIERLTE